MAGAGRDPQSDRRGGDAGHAWAGGRLDRNRAASVTAARIERRIGHGLLRFGERRACRRLVYVLGGVVLVVGGGVVMVVVAVVVTVVGGAASVAVAVVVT